MANSTRGTGEGDPADRLGKLITVVSADREELVAGVLTDDDLRTLKHLAKKWARRRTAYGRSPRT